MLSAVSHSISNSVIDATIEIIVRCSKAVAVFLFSCAARAVGRYTSLAYSLAQISPLASAIRPSGAVPEPTTNYAALQKIVLISTMPPLRCGLASFTGDLMAALDDAAPELDLLPVAMSSIPSQTAAFTIVPHDFTDYARVGTALNRSEASLICVQHEYGIFGGPDGSFLLELLDQANAPVVVTIHTALDRPSPNQRRVMDAIIDRAARVVTMTADSAAIMRAEHGVGAGKLCVIPHGTHLAQPNARALGRTILAAGERPVMLTFGLLSPGKGIEHAIRALPAIVANCPDVLYVVLGVTHPNLLRDEGERYRTSLQTLAADLGMQDNVRFLNRFVELPELLSALAATDVYVTPYVNEAQSVSGTLAYSYALGTPVVSTPYRHAAELLANGRGVLVPFADPDALAVAITGLLTDRTRLDAIRSAALEAGRETAWPCIGTRYLDLFRDVVSTVPAKAALAVA